MYAGVPAVSATNLSLSKVSDPIVVRTSAGSGGTSGRRVTVTRTALRCCTAVSVWRRSLKVSRRTAVMLPAGAPA